MKKLVPISFLVGLAFCIDGLAQNVGLFYPMSDIKSPCWYDIEYSTPKKAYFVTYISNPVTREYCDEQAEMLGKSKVTPLDDGNVIIEMYDEKGELDPSSQFKLEKANTSIKALSPLKFTMILTYWNMSSQDIKNCLQIDSNHGVSIFHFTNETPILGNNYHRGIEKMKKICDNFAPAGMKCINENYQYGDKKVSYYAVPVSSSACNIHLTFTFGHRYIN